jgi:outer membrane lipoprotein SlyB
MKRLAALLLAFSLTGCAMLDGNSLTASTAVQIGTIRLIQAADDPAERAEDIIVIVDLVNEQIDGDAITTVSSAGDAVRGFIDYSQLGPYEQILLDSLISAVQARLLEEVGSGELDEQSVIRVKNFLSYARQAATVYQDG